MYRELDRRWPLIERAHVTSSAATVLPDRVQLRVLIALLAPFEKFTKAVSKKQFSIKFAGVQASSRKATFFDDVPLWTEILETLASTRARLRQLHLPVDEHLENALEAMVEKMNDTANNGRRALFTVPQWNDGNLADVNKYGARVFDKMSNLHFLLQLALFDLLDQPVHTGILQGRAA